MKAMAGMVAVLALAAAAAADPAPGHREEFAGGMAGWIDRDPGELVVAHDAAGNPGGSIAGTFAALGGPVPETDAMQANAASSGGAFTGNYRAQYARIAGWRFDVRAASVLPSGALLRFGNEGTNFFRSITNAIPTTGAWHRVFVPLDGTAGWSGPLAAFSNALLDVEFVELQFTRNGESQQVYAVDNFELVRLDPHAAAAAVQGAAVSVTWSELKPGAHYEVEAATNLVGTVVWTPLGGFSATNSTVTWTNAVSAGDRLKFYRLVLPTPAL